MDINELSGNADWFVIGGSIVSVGVGAYTQMKKYGITWDKIKVKMAVPYDIAKAIYHQDNEKVAQKVNIDDTLVEYLQKLAPGDDGTIDIEQAKKVIEDCVRWNNHKLQMLQMRQK